METNVRPEKIRELRERMKALGIEEEDLVEKFVRSRGRGGQKVNKTSSCVYLMHVPTGTEVKCREGRSRSINRFFARRRLVEKIEKLLLGAESPSEKERMKMRKQKLRRRRRGRDTKASQTAGDGGRMINEKQ
jgi:protein subunit release factor B